MKTILYPYTLLLLILTLGSCSTENDPTFKGEITLDNDTYPITEFTLDDDFSVDGLGNIRRTYHAKTEIGVYVISISNDGDIDTYDLAVGSTSVQVWVENPDETRLSAQNAIIKGTVNNPVLNITGSFPIENIGVDFSMTYN